MPQKLAPEEMTQVITQYHLIYRNLFKNLLKSSSMPIAQYHILDILSHESSMRMGEISDLMAISRPNLTPLIDKLVNLQYVKRTSDKNDRRVIYVAITQKGRDMLEVEQKALVENIQKMLKNFTAEEYDQFCLAISILIELANKM